MSSIRHRGKKANTVCPECSGSPRGQGYHHKEGCSMSRSKMSKSAMPLLDRHNLTSRPLSNHLSTPSRDITLLRRELSSLVMTWPEDGLKWLSAMMGNY